MNYRKLEETIMADEDFRALPYLDTEKVWTIGYGNTIYQGQRVHAQTPATTESEARHELRADIFSALLDAQAVYPELDSLPGEVQRVLAEMAYQMGRDGLASFKLFRKAILAGDWKGAAVRIRKSLWYRQTRNRAERAAKRIESVGV